MIDVIVKPKTTWKSEVMSVLGMALAFLPTAISALAGHFSPTSLAGSAVAIAGIVMNYVKQRQDTKQEVIKANASIQVQYDPAQDPNLKK